MEVKIGQYETISDHITCSSGRKLDSIMKEIGNNISDAFMEISMHRQREERGENPHQYIDTLENVEGFLCKISELVKLIK